MEEDEDHCNTSAALSCAGFAAAIWPAPQVKYIKKKHNLYRYASFYCCTKEGGVPGAL